MQLSDRDKYIIERYKEDEEMMILLFAQWCVNNNIDANELYEKAYPHQAQNKALKNAIEQTVPKEDSEFISQQIIISILQMFGNDDLAFEVGQIEVLDETEE
ncbi:MAG TPA: hypothetical protein VK085_04460 [Pseudogracilibacillus sp.]|nr:hypothetical protein [Pseudogracilibacillus sp.]